MNYYERHIGDYLKDTAHLTLLEHGVYGRLLDVYYTRESAIPDANAARLVGARTRDEIAALKAVLTEFFSLSADGRHWVHQRCEREIARFNEGEPEREAKKANERNRLSKHRQERARLFKAITDAGQHAPWNVGIQELRDLAKRVSANADQPFPATAPATPATATHTPHPSSHNSLTHTQSSPPELARVSSGTEAGGVCRAMRQHGIPDANPGHIDLLRLLQAGATPEEFEGAAREAAGKGKGFAYALGIVKRRREEAAAGAVLHRGPLPAERDDRKARQLATAAHLTGAAAAASRTTSQPVTLEVDHVARLTAPAA